MTKSVIKAVTFDLWDTVFIDDSDEPKRAKNGQRSKPAERRALVLEFLAPYGHVSKEQVDIAYDVADAAFRQVWYGQNITWTVKERLAVLLKGLGRKLAESELGELTRLHEEMELEVRPDLAPGVEELLGSLYGKYRLGVISDAIFSPGRVLRQLLAGYNLERFFSSFVFSDEVGSAKPTPFIFENAASDLGVRPGELVHIGDREQKDVIGPHSVGARAVLCTVVKDRGSANTSAQAICASFADLPVILSELGGD